MSPIVLWSLQGCVVLIHSFTQSWAHCVCLLGAQTKGTFTAKTFAELVLKALLASSPPVQWLKTPPPKTEESSLPYWAQSPGKER